MAKTVLKGLKASTSNFMAFRLSAKLSEDITMLVKVLRFLKTKFGGLRVEKSSRNIACKFRGQSCQSLKLVLAEQGSGDPPGMTQAGRVGLPATETSKWVDLGPNLSVKQLYLASFCSNQLPCMARQSVNLKL
ncbi:hypothetical protein Hanom_Chr03g00248701 [Helianthus anomalus]